MAGDIEEPLRLSFQGDYFHSDSISFGRFEAEALCWERRSSFSHNRYLEEVERCSKPGSVTEKKAYFEAHFKRKALLNQNSLQCQSEINCETTDKEHLQNMCQEDIEHLNEDSHMTSYEENPAHTVHDQSEMAEYGFDYSGYYEPEIEYTFDSGSNEESIVHENVKIEEPCDVGSGNSPRSNGELENEAKQILNDNGETATSDKPLESCNWLPSSPKTEIGDCSNGEPGSFPQVKIASQTKGLMTHQPSVVKAKKIMSRETSKGFMTQPANKETDVSMRSRKEKQKPDSTASTTHSVPRTLKTAASQSSKAQLHENKSLVKKPVSKTAMNSRPSTSEWVAPRAQQNANRPMRAVCSTNPVTKQYVSTFSFRSDERSERRKEFNMKLGEKMLAKETAVQQVKAKKKEKTEADIKELRKSLGFKLKPMPSFYTEAGNFLDKNKAVANDYKSSKVQNTPSSSGVAYTKRSLSFRSFRSGEACFTKERLSNSQEVSSETSYPSAICSANTANFSEVTGRKSHPTLAAVDKLLAGTQEHEEVKHRISRNHRALENNPMNKGQKIEGKQKVGVERRTKGLMRKDIKGVVDPRNSSRMGSFAVGTAS